MRSSKTRRAQQVRARPVRTHPLLNGHLDAPVLVNCRAGVVAQFTRPKPGKLPNEDCAVTIDMPKGQCIVAVADGVGGAPQGHKASRAAINALIKCVNRSAGKGSLRTPILDAFEAANAAVAALKVGAATTLVVAEYFENAIRTYHTGDSGALLIGQRGKLKHKTVFHSPVGYAERARVITEKEALRHKRRHIVSNLVGVDGMTVEVSTAIQFSRRDTLLVSSDGVFDNARIKEIKADIRTGKPLLAASRLLNRISSRMDNPQDDEISKPDDLTFAMFRAL